MDKLQCACNLSATFFPRCISIFETLMDHSTNPYSPPEDMETQRPEQIATRQNRGPLIYFAVAVIVSFILAVPLIVPKSLAPKDDPNPLGYLLLLISFPVGGLVFRLRSRNWPIDTTVRKRQWIACFATLLLPLSVAALTGMRGQGFEMAILSGFVSLILMSGIFISGQRRN